MCVCVCEEVAIKWGMDWDWKEFAWDPCELELGLEVQKNEAVAEAEASVDLRLGGEVSSDSVEKSTPDTPKDSKAVSSSPPSSGSSKRSRLQNGSQNFSCLVDGCDSDLGDCREYHRRHRVCEKHSKTPVVLVGGKQQRFCQQCSRYGLEFVYVGWLEILGFVEFLQFCLFF